MARREPRAAAAETERGWRVRKLKATARIDACVAACMAYSRAAQNLGGFSYVMALDRLED